MTEIQSCRDLDDGAELSADVVIVGSGAGGAVIAAELAAAGQCVVILEEGPHITPERFAAMRPSESIRHAWRDGAMTVAFGVKNTPMVNVTMGRCVGGTSTLTGGVCFRAPQSVHDVWSKQRKLTELTAEGLAPFYDRVEQDIHVEEVDASKRSRSTQLFSEGAEQLGFSLKPLRRNTINCRGCGRCNFGCPHQAKQSVDLVYLPRALKDGAQIFSDCLVNSILTKGDRAVGVTGRALDERGKPHGHITVHSKRVVICAGSYHTPLILQASKVGRQSKQVGRNLTLHPAFRMIARFDEPVRGWSGALQSAYSDSFEHERITMVGLFVPPAVLGATMPGFGREHTDRTAKIANLALFGGLIHDEGGGVVRPGRGREPFVTYRMDPKDRVVVPKLIRRMAETFRAAGAKEIFLPIFGAEPITPDQLDSYDFEHIPGRRFESASQHPLGSCRMGTEAKSSVVDPNGECWDLKELWVGDGSVVPTSLGVNPQLTIMAMALRIASKMLERPLP